MAVGPIFVGTPKFANIVLTNTNAGDAAYINPTTIATLLTIEGTGGRVDNVYLQPVGTNASCVVRFWVDTVGTGGIANRLVKEVYLPSSSSSAVAPLPSAIWSPGLVLPAAAVLRATIGNTALTNGVAISVEYGAF